MKFEDIQLYEAIYDVRRDMEKPGSEKWVQFDGNREELCRRIQSFLPVGSLYTIDDMFAAWVDFRKASSKCNGVKWAELVVLVARAHGRLCFWRGRVGDDCSCDVTVDRLRPGSRGGEYIAENCVLSCKHHNSARGDRPVEEFLQKGGKQ